MLIDMIHDNHGEPPFKTRFRDPALLKSYGYDAIVIPDAIPALTGTHESALSAISHRLAAATDAGLKTFFYGDALLLPRATVDASPPDFLCDDHSGRLCPAKPAVLAATADLVRALFDRWPSAAGLIMRTGEVYPEATPHMVGNPLHAAACPTCRTLSLTARLQQFIAALYAVVGRDLGKLYIHRAWQPTPSGVPNVHDDPEIYRAVSSALPPPAETPTLAFSFKFTRGDFRATSPFNACVMADARPKWIEFQCEREFEGKGAFPNFQPVMWAKFLASLDAKVESREDQADLPSPAPTPTLASLPRPAAEQVPDLSFFGWSRGGGWGGPYAQREEWLDANVFGLSQLHRNPAADPRAIASTWAEIALGVAHESAAAAAVAEVLLLSRSAVDKLFYVHQLPAEHTPALLKDDLLDVTAVWTAAVRLAESPHLEAACQDKRDGLAAVERMRRLFETASAELTNKSQARDLLNTLIFFNSVAGTITGLFCGFAYFLQWNRTGRNDTSLARRAIDELEHAQAHWQHHTQRHALLPGAASVFQENTLWERTNDCLEQLQGAV